MTRILLTHAALANIDETGFASGQPCASCRLPLASIAGAMHYPSMTNASAFGRIETCSCCGRDVKRPVFSKRLGAHFGRACMDSILATRQAYQFGGLMAATREAMTYKPRTWQTHLAYAIA